jgi:hypothetical protein
MANQLKMAEIQAVTALLQQGWSQRRIARELGLDRETVARYAHRWQEATAKPANLRPGSDADFEAKPANLRLGSEEAVEAKPAILRPGSEPVAEAQDPLLAGLPAGDLIAPSCASAGSIAPAGRSVKSSSARSIRRCRRSDNNSYSVPRSFAFSTVSVKGYVAHIEIVAGAQVISRHSRSYEQGVQILDPLHYLAVLGRKPAALDHANVYKHWQLPAVFAELRVDLERRRGLTAGARQYIRVLQLLAEHSVSRVERAIVMNHGGSGYDIEAIIKHCHRAAERADVSATVDLTGTQAIVTAVQVPLPNLRQFDQLLSREEVSDERTQHAVGEVQLETIALADDPCRVREAGTRGSDGQRELRAIPPRGCWRVLRADAHRGFEPDRTNADSSESRANDRSWCISK